MGVHVGALTEQMDWNDRAGPRGDGRFEERRVHRVGAVVDVDKDRSRAAVGDGFGGGHEGHGHGEHLVAGANPERQQSEPECVGPVAHTDGGLRAAVSREFLLEPGDKRSAGESPGVDDLFNGRAELGLGAGRDGRGDRGRGLS